MTRTRWPTRFRAGLVVSAWLVATGWLVVDKIAPLFQMGDPPDYRLVASAAASSQPAPETWRLLWEDRPIGFAANVAREGTAGAAAARGNDGAAVETRGVFRFERLRLDEILGKFLGPLAPLTRGLAPASQGELDLVIAQRARFDARRRFVSLDASVSLDNMASLLLARGETEGQTMRLAVFLRDVEGGAAPYRRVFQDAFELPPQALVGDALAPRSRLTGLTLGQRWKIPVHRTFPPQQAVQMLDAKVEAHEIIVWEGRSWETLRVAYRPEQGDGVSASAPVGVEWVRPEDGLVLRQQALLSNLWFRMDRVPAEKAKRQADWLDDKAFDALFPAELPPIREPGAGK